MPTIVVAVHLLLMQALCKIEAQRKESLMNLGNLENLEFTLQICHYLCRGYASVFDASTVQDSGSTKREFNEFRELREFRVHFANVVIAQKSLTSLTSLNSLKYQSKNRP